MEREQLSRKRLRVGVLFGGRSGEHEISLQSAASVVAALDPALFELVPIGITKEGRWLASGDPLAELSGGQLQISGRGVSLLPDPTERGALHTVDERAAPGPVVDVVFPVLHGPFGEDGTVQGLLELADLPYVGSGVLGSSAGMDKVVMKALLRDAGLPVTPGISFLRADWERDPAAIRERCADELGFPFFVKPANLGSSVGISKIHGPRETDAAINDAAAYDRKILAEVAIPQAREIEIAVLGNDDPQASLPGEIKPSREFYDYTAKYLDGTSELLIPAPLPEELVHSLRSMAIAAFRAVDCAGLARVDFLVRGNDLQVFLNEVNTMPGFTSISMYPKLWEASGVPYRALVARLIDLAQERHRERRRNRTDYPRPKAPPDSPA